MLSKILILAGAIALGAALQAAETLVTRDGTSYTNAVFQRAEPNGIVVEYTPAPGSVGIAKLKFQNLPDEIQRKYGYDPREARVFENNQARAIAQNFAAQEKAERLAEAEKTRRLQERALQWEREEAAAKAAAENERRMQEQAKVEAALAQEAARQQKAADDAFMQRWRIQDNQFDSMDRSLKENVRRTGIQNYQLNQIGRDLNDINRKLR